MIQQIEENVRTIRRIVLHSDLDAWLTTFLCRHYGHRHEEPHFDEVALAEPLFGDVETIKAQGLARSECLIIDQLGGDIDHHEPGSPYRSAAEKAAKLFGVYGDLGVRQLVDLVSEADQGLAGREPIVQWARAVQWYLQEEPGRAYRLFAQLFRGIIRLHRAPERLPLDWNLDGWLRDRFPMTPEMNRVLRPILRGIRRQATPLGRSKAIFSTKGLAAALRYGSPHPAQFDRNFETLLYALLEWQLEGERAEAEAEQSECVEVGGIKIAYGTYRSDRFTEFLRRKHRPQIVIGEDPDRGIIGISAHAQSGITLREIAEAVRSREAVLRGQMIGPGVPLDQAGVWFGWFLHGTGRLLLCGSRTTPPPEGKSLISLDELVGIVTQSLEAKQLQPSGAV